MSNGIRFACAAAIMGAAWLLVPDEGIGFFLGFIVGAISNGQRTDTAQGG